MTSITLDETALMMLRLLREHEGEEPTDPANLGGSAPWAVVDEAARKHDKWDELRSAMLLMLSARLINLALEQTE